MYRPFIRRDISFGEMGLDSQADEESYWMALSYR
jgi:hypothetical protein